MENALRTFTLGSSGGPDGITPQQRRDLLCCATEDNPLTSLTELVNILLDVDLPTEVNEIIFGGRLMALEKKGEGIRPIEIDYTWRRLAAKCANRHIISRRGAALQPIQLGVGVPG